MSAEVQTRDLVVTRVFDAPVEKVWAAWSEPELVKRWWGPTYFTSPVARMDFREGGVSLVCMRSPDGQDYYNTWAYRTITPMRYIEYILNFSDSEGNRIDPVSVGLPPNLPQNVRNTVAFRAMDDGRTEMVVTEYGYVSVEVLEMSKMGLEQCLDKMAEMLAG